VTRRKSARWARLFHRLRTEGDTPVRQAFAVGLGLFIGCTPFYGLHLTLAILFGTLFGLNRLKVYVAANISNPFVAPFLYASEAQVGSWLRRGTWYSLSGWSNVTVWHVAVDVLLGALIVGTVLGAAGGALTYAVVNRRGLTREVGTLLDAAAGRFVDDGVAAWEFAHGKLRNDPVYLDILRKGVLPASGTLVDIGCGQGLMLALLVAARDAYRRGEWPRGWPPPPLEAALVGVELRKDVAALAAHALEGEATIIDRDLIETPIPPCQAVLIFDVLHLMPAVDQERALGAVAAALTRGGVLVLREADAAGGWRFTAVRVGNRLTALVQRKWRRVFHFRTAAEWRALVRSYGFDVEEPVATGSAPFANVTLYARKAVG
jgi:uncharacterized protein (DUF2062 family)/SAM-dependent methyltransferase